VPVYGLPPEVYRDGGVVRPPAGRFPGRPVRTALVLGGGGNRGAAQVGMLRAFVEEVGSPDLVVGTSIGALNGAAFAGSPTIEGVYLAAEVWRRIGVDDVFPRSRFHGSWRFLEKRPSVFSMDRLREVVASYLRFELLEDALVPLLLIATRLEDGKEEWFTEGPAIDAVMASAALPGMYPAVEIAGKRYFDGGVLNNVGISAALSYEPERIFVFLCGRVDAAAPRFTRPYEALFAAFTLALSSRVRRDLSRIPEDVEVIVVELPGASMFDPQDFSRTDLLIEEGYQLARSVLDAYAEERQSPRATLLRRGTRRRSQSSPATSRAEETPPGSTR
jgi:NTE family protein